MPAGVVGPVVSVKVEEPAPGAAMDGGVNAAVVPGGNPDALRATGESKPPATVVVIALVPLAPCATETEAGEAEIAKAGAAVTVRVTVAVCVMLPPVPVTVIVCEPVVAVEATVMVMVEAPAPGAAMDAGLKLTVTPAG